MSTYKEELSKAEIESLVVGNFMDGLSNLSTGLGTSKDKTFYNEWDHSGRNSDHVTLSARYREDWLSQKIINIVPQDMTREWRIFNKDIGKEADKEFKIQELFRLAYKWARLYGTSFIVLDIADGRTTDKPVNWNRLKPGCLKSLQVVDRTRIVATGDINHDPLALNFGMPTNYQFVNQSTTIHIDRLIRFEGTELPTYERMRNLWYSDSILIPLMEQIDIFHSVSKSSAQMAQEAVVDVVSIQGLGEILSTDHGSSAMLKRFSEWKRIKSVFGVSILDASEEYEQKNIQLSGVKDFLWQTLEVVAASVGIPVTRFLSVSPTGLSNNGHADVVNYVEYLKGLQKSIFNPRIKIIDTLLAAHYGLSEEDLEFEWACIFPESTAEKGERFKVLSESLALICSGEVGILSRESALQLLKDEGFIDEMATLGELTPEPTVAPTKTK